MAKRLVKENYVVTVNQEQLTLNSNRMGAFTCICRNYGGRVLYATDLKSLVNVWNQLIELGYSVEECPVSAPKRSLYTMKFVTESGKEISGRSIWSREYSRRRAAALAAVNNFKGMKSEEYRPLMNELEKRVKEEMKIWEQEYLSQF